MSASGDRHLRPDPAGLLPGTTGRAHVVAIAANPGYATSFAGQALLRLLVDLVARQFGVVRRLELHIPSVRSIPRAVGGRSERDLASALLAVGQAAGGPEISVTASAEPKAPNLIYVGGGRPPEGERSLLVTAVAESWSATVSDVELVPATDTGDLPFGPHLAAALAADRLFRALHGVAIHGASHLELLDPVERAMAAERMAGLRLPPAYLIGLGAVGAAALSSLSAANFGSTIVGIDPDAADVTSRNRLLSMRYDQVGVSKAELARALVKGSSVEFYENALAWPAYYGEPDRHRPTLLADSERGYRFEWILSAVDKNIPRRDIANILPRHVLSGSTNGLVAQCAYLDMEGDCECLACNNPIPTFDLDAVRDELSQLAADDRVQRLREMGASDEDLVAVEIYLNDPGCGGVGEATLRRLGVDGGVDWSVGFVSAAAGTLMAANFVRAAAFGPAAITAVGAERRLIFWGTPELTDSQARRKPACPVCGDPDTQLRYRSRWDG